MKKVSIVLAGALVATAAFGYEFAHPNLRDADGAIGNAIHHIELAQSANRGVEFGGHAEKAIELLRHAREELEESERYRDSHRR